MTKIVGLYNWHDGGYCVLESGKVVEHIEFERYTRIKECGGDSLKYLTDIYLRPKNLSIDDVDYWVSPCPDTNLEKNSDTIFNTHDVVPKDKIKFYSHHLCHAAHAFYSSSFRKSMILTIDSAGLESNGEVVSTCGYLGDDKEIQKTFGLSSNQYSLGNLWGKCTRFIFKLSSGYPRGHQAGSVMAMAAFGDPEKYYDEFMKMATHDFALVKQTPPGYKRGVYVPPEEDVIHPYLNRFRLIAEEDEQEKMNMAASLQKVTEDIIFNLIGQMIDHAKENNLSHYQNLCLAGGVSLNSAFTGKILAKFKGEIENVFVPPVPYDGGLSIGACQYHWHSVLGNDRDYDNHHVSPYLGQEYSKEDVETAIEKKIDLLDRSECSLEECAQLLAENNIVSVFQGRSESGRRALGNRSILANPANPNMKDLINKKVKHRQWYRPFAPSVLHECGEEWFENYFESPYMGFVFKVKDEKLGKAPAIEHKNGTARLQSVTKKQNPGYYRLISEFKKLTGVPIVLNTSFNDREPICETPEHAINCFLNTDIDFLYFPKYKTLLKKTAK